MLLLWDNLFTSKIQKNINNEWQIVHAYDNYIIFILYRNLGLKLGNTNRCMKTQTILSICFYLLDKFLQLLYLFYLFTRSQKPDVQSQVICPSSWSNESHWIPGIIVQNLNHEKSNSLFSYKMHRTIHEKYLGCGSVETSLYRVLNSSNHFLKGF